jgi:mono/diheme cytochrome c family protein
MGTNHAPLTARIPLLLAALAVAGCRQDMHDNPRYEAYERSEFFGDERSMRPQVEGTVARGQLREDQALFAGKSGAAFVARTPVAVTADLVRRGRQRYEIYCAPCHGVTGRGDGIVVRRGFRAPTTFHADRLRAQPDGYLYDVITNGFGAMPDYASQIPVADRWAIVSYVRALQLSQHARFDALPKELQNRVRQGTSSAGVARQPADRGLPGTGHAPEARPQEGTGH